MPARTIARPRSGAAKPASAVLSPVARDYPSLRFRRVFQAAVRLTVLSRNGAERAVLPLKSHGFLLHNLFTAAAPVHNR